MVQFAHTHSAIRLSARQFRIARAWHWTPQDPLPIVAMWPDGHETLLLLRILTSQQASGHRRCWLACPKCRRRVEQPMRHHRRTALPVGRASSCATSPSIGAVRGRSSGWRGRWAPAG